MTDDAPTTQPPENKAAAPVQTALKTALTEVDSPAKAEAVIGELEAVAAGKTAADLQQTQPSPQQAARQVKEAVDQAPPGEAARTALAETARVVVAADGREREAVSAAAQRVFNPEQEGAPAMATEPQREYLRQAVLRRLRPLDALDANLFIAINHLPHTRWLNGFFHFITVVFNAGAAWYALVALAGLRNRRFGWQVAREAAVPLAVATAVVEYPIKSYFRRRRPFIEIIQAIVIGRKPGTWSFPSGHSASAFAGAWLLHRHYPRLGGLLYTVAGLVGFSRIYLGNHYPGDVLAGSAAGIVLAWLLRRLPWPWRKRDG